MKNTYLIFAILIIVFSCKQRVEEPIQNYHLTKNIVNPEESLNIIETSQEFELKHNKIFQQDLQIKSKEYYDNVVESFIDKETGFFKLFGELSNRVFKSESDRKTLWKLKIERYFRTTSFLTFIRNEVNRYTDGVNNQRKNGVSKLLGTKHTVDINLPIIVAHPFNVNDQSVDKIITKINEEINDQLIDIAFDLTFEFIILPLLLIFFAGSLLLGEKGLPLTIIVTILFIIFFIWRSNVRQNEMRDELKIECYKVLKTHNIDYTNQLNKYTNEYYSQLQKTIYETNK
jgi:hypothetical protein